MANSAALRVAELKTLKALARFRELSIPQLARYLYTPRCVTTVRGAVQRLAECDRIYRLHLPREDGAGRGLTVCGLTGRGATLARRHGAWVRDGYRGADERRRAHSTLRHELAVRDVIISALTLRRSNPRFTVGEVVTEGDFRREPGIIEIGDERRRVQPDAWLDLRHVGVGNWFERLPLLLELERSGSAQTIRAKLDRYLDWTMAGYGRRFGSGDPRILFVAPGDPFRAAMLRHCIHAHLRARGMEALAWMFPVTAANAAELSPAEFWFGPHWYSDGTRTARPLLIPGRVQDSHMGSFLHLWNLTEDDLIPQITLYQRERYVKL